VFIFKFSNYFFINFYTSIKEPIKSHSSKKTDNLLKLHL
ncbi:unnamed protein product, partial [marine sediment metagenome]